jgi:hypothetical protein
MILTKTVTAAIAFITLAGSIGGVIVAGDARYLMKEVYASEQRNLAKDIRRVQVSVLKSDRRQIQAQIFAIETKPTPTTFEKQRLQELKVDLSDIQQQVKALQ